MKIAYDWYDNMSYIVPESKEEKAERVKFYGMVAFVVIFAIAIAVAL